MLRDPMRAGMKMKQERALPFETSVGGEKGLQRCRREKILGCMQGPVSRRGSRQNREFGGG